MLFLSLLLCTYGSQHTLTLMIKCVTVKTAAHMVYVYDYCGTAKTPARIVDVHDFQLLHRDLAARNVLVDDSMICKVCDFGSSRDIAQMRQYESQTQVSEHVFHPSLVQKQPQWIFTTTKNILVLKNGFMCHRIVILYKSMKSAKRCDRNHIPS